MKTMSMIVTIGLMAASLTACRKDDSTTLSTPPNDPPASSKLAAVANNSANIAIPAGYTNTYNGGIVAYTLTMSGQQSGSLLSWSSGYITPGLLTFEGFEQRGNAWHRQYNEIKTSQQSLPLFTNTILGGLPVGAGAYSEINFTIASAQPANGYSMYLAGTYGTGGNTIPVQVIVTDPFVLHSQLNCCTSMNYTPIIVDSAHAYTANFSLNMMAVTDGISSAMLANAATANGMVTISAGSNNAIYQIVLNNLAKNIICAFSAGGVNISTGPNTTTTALAANQH